MKTIKLMTITISLILILTSLVFMQIRAGARFSTSTEKVESTGMQVSDCIDYFGTYEGNLPLEDNFIMVTLTLNKDFTFSLMKKFAGNEELDEETGSFILENGEIVAITLRNSSIEYYKIIPEGLLKLDDDKKVIEGDKADWYILKRIA